MTDEKQTLGLNNAAALLLKSVLPIPGWYEGLPMSVGLAGVELQEGPLADVKEPKTPDEEWAQAPVEIGVTSKHKSAIEGVTKWLVKTGGVGLGLGLNTLVWASGLAKERDEDVKHHAVTLGNGIFGLLLHLMSTVTVKQGQPQPAWFAGKEAHLVADAYSLRERLRRDLGIESMEDEPPESWVEEETTVHIPEHEREAAKACIKHYYDKSALDLTPQVAKLIKELGLTAD